MELFKLRVENLGRIADAELSIRPLTVFIGPNNTNKTWTAYSLFSLVKYLTAHFRTPWLSERVDLDAVIGRNEHLLAAADSVVSNALSSLASASEGTTVLGEVTRAEMLSDMAYPARFYLRAAGLAQVLAIPEKQTTGASVVLEMSADQFSVSDFDRLSFELEKHQGGRCAVEVKRTDGQVASASGRGVLVPGPQAAEDVLRWGIQRLLLPRFNQVVAFPAERKALMTVYNLLEQSFQDLVSLPVAEFVGLLRYAQTFALHREETQISAVPSLLEERILHGNVEFRDGNTPLSLAYAGSGEPHLTIHAASSLVRALAGLDVYLKYIGGRGDLIVIDEPEMNAHPEAQLAITELLGVLVNVGIHVVVTTHSPYVAEHVGNLVEAAHLPQAKQDRIASRFKLGTKEAFVPAEKVSVYLFGEDGRVRDVFDRERRNIDLSTFGTTSDRVDNLFSDVLEEARRE